MNTVRQGNGREVDVQRDQRAPDALCLALHEVRSRRFIFPFLICVLHPSLLLQPRQ